MVNYVSDFICTYNLIDDLEDSELLYRTQLLQAFFPEYFSKDNKKSLDEVLSEISYSIKELYDKYGSNKIVKNLMSKYPENRDDINFNLCFSYSSFYLIHKIICGLINDNLDENVCNKLIKDLEINN